MDENPEQVSAMLLAELEELERRERELSDLRGKLHERIDKGFPNEFTLRHERQVSDERRQLQREIDAVRGRLQALGVDLQPTA
jgi:hypothetical protein